MNKYEAEFSNLVRSFSACKLVDLFVDIDIDRDFGMSVFVFDEEIEKKFSS